MIVIDTSALIAIVNDEPEALVCREALASQNRVLINAATLTEALIVARGKDCLSGLTALIDRLPLTVIDLDDIRAEVAYAQWGKGFHKASLNFGDCFAYATASEFECPLLYIGDDFARTDIASAVARSDQ